MGLIEFPAFLDRYVEPFRSPSWVYEPDRGFIVWRRGTGDNVELLHVRAAVPHQGHGRWLVYRMLDHLRANPPYHSVYGYTRIGNNRAREFYAALGFRCQEVDGIYAEGAAVLFWGCYTRLVELKGEHERGA